MPLANCTTPANGNEREQVLPLLHKVQLKTLKPGRPRKRLKVLAADMIKVMIAKISVLLYVGGELGLKYLNESGKPKKIEVDQLKFQFQGSNRNVVLRGIATARLVRTLNSEYAPSLPAR